MNQSPDDTPWGLILGMAVLIAFGALFAALVAEDPSDPAERALAEQEAAGGQAEDQQEADPDAQAGEIISAGRDLFFTNNCNACHGNNAEGGIGPALPGHTSVQVVRQARSPIGQMPLFTRLEISDADLDKIAAFIASLPLAEHQLGHGGTGVVAARDVLATHHWMALNAIKAENEGEAQHHVGHIIDIVQGEHLQAMLHVQDELAAAGWHDAEHTIQEMLTGFVPGVTADVLHLRLGLQAVVVGDVPDARHQMEHYQDLFVSGDRSVAAAVTASLVGGDLHEAEERIRTLLGDLAPGAGEEAHEEEEGEEDQHEEEGADDHEGDDGADE